MGADGGINWMEVFGDIQEFYRLVRPLRVLWSGSGTGHDHEHQEWLRSNLFKDRKQRIFSVYGTDCQRGGMNELKEIIEYWQSQRDPHEHDYYWEQTNPLLLTWEEILFDYLAHPHYKPKYTSYGIRHPWEVPPPVVLMWDEYHFDANLDTFKIEYKYMDAAETFKILRMTTSEWLQKIESLVNLETVGSERTWT